MQDFNIVKKSAIDKTFRVESIKGTYDLNIEETEEVFSGQIDISGDWNIGVIYGRSGTGKTSIAEDLFGDSIKKEFPFSAGSVVDDMPKKSSMIEITKAFNSVGFSSPPSWLKPYHVLSNGEKMRCQLAFCILDQDEVIVFDEFTSVVDRTVAKIGSIAMQKAIRKQRKKFIAIACHDDILDWLKPDWELCTNDMTFVKKKESGSVSTSKSKKQKTSRDIGKCLLNITI